ncbi:MAG: HipA N-terminal domain-containing protein [Prosthecobacter sp.]|uniref:HipA N-terminal domain-containing protein n=1 Tax=Prosthecobacter sp. TaxID=1965333 RepID=UPI003902E2D1
MSRIGNVYYGGELAGQVQRRDEGHYAFNYRPDYLAKPHARPVSLTLPLQQAEFESPVLFPFFSGLLAEGNLKELQCRLHRIDPDDDFTRLLKTTRHDVIGAVTVEEVPA